MRLPTRTSTKTGIEVHHLIPHHRAFLWQFEASRKANDNLHRRNPRFHGQIACFRRPKIGVFTAEFAGLSGRDCQHVSEEGRARAVYRHYDSVRNIAAVTAHYYTGDGGVSKLILA